MIRLGGEDRTKCEKRLQSPLRLMAHSDELQSQENVRDLVQTFSKFLQVATLRGYVRSRRRWKSTNARPGREAISSGGLSLWPCSSLSLLPVTESRTIFRVS